MIWVDAVTPSSEYKWDLYSTKMQAKPKIMCCHKSTRQISYFVRPWVGWGGGGNTDERAIKIPKYNLHFAASSEYEITNKYAAFPF